MASQVLITITKDEVEQARLRSELKYELDTQSRLAYAEQEGLKKGRREGFEKGQEEIARNALAKDIPLELIRDITGLDIESIQKIQKGDLRTEGSHLN